MAEIIFTHSFVDDTDAVILDSKLAEIMDAIGLLEASPFLGSANLPAGIVERFGPKVRKLVVDSFDVIYEYLTEEDAVLILGLIHQRAAF